jgi:hypothetical protein
MAPDLVVRDVELLERQVRFRVPFRFGDVTVTSAPQLFVIADIDIAGKRARGATAELMVPRWFDKNPRLTTAQTVDELRQSIRIARDLYLSKRAPQTAFALHAAVLSRQLAACAQADIPPLAALYGPAEIDKAILDALLRHLNLDVFTGLARNVVGLDGRLSPDLDQSTINRFLSGQTPPATIAVRHTVGMVDPAESIVEAAHEGGCRYFKIKLRGEPESDLRRLRELIAVFEQLGLDYRATLDANEQYGDISQLRALVTRLGDREFDGFARRLLYIEQPFSREVTLTNPLGEIGRRFAFIIDEADDHYDAFLQARECGYRGVSSKACKGLYKSLLNGARSMIWNAGGARATFIAAEDLTCQAGLAIQQDTALAAFLGCEHVERNGHHYVEGFADTPSAEAEAFLSVHPELYHRSHDGIRLTIKNGLLAIGSLRVPGFASGLDPEIWQQSRQQQSTTMERVR